MPDAPYIAGSQDDIENKVDATQLGSLAQLLGVGGAFAPGYVYGGTPITKENYPRMLDEAARLGAPVGYEKVNPYASKKNVEDFHRMGDKKYYFTRPPHPDFVESEKGRIISDFVRTWGKDPSNTFSGQGVTFSPTGKVRPFKRSEYRNEMLPPQHIVGLEDLSAPFHPERAARTSEVHIYPDSGAGVLTHELGHAAQGPIGKTLRKMYKASRTASFGTSPLASIISTSFDDPAYGAAAATINSVASAPMIAEEIRASALGAKMMRRAGVRGRLGAFVGLPTYLSASALPWIGLGVQQTVRKPGVEGGSVLESTAKVPESVKGSSLGDFMSTTNGKMLVGGGILTAAAMLALMGSRA